jgi:50S ribosomal protein L16 3-hydroxylase
MVMNTSANLLLGGLTPESFLADYWQKKPLLIRNAIPGFQSPISPDELAGLACESEVESRLILERNGPEPWTVEYGPFAEERFSNLPQTHWTLLVQECNKYVQELATLMERFDFIPSWRVDDVMVSYAPHQGTVGPHTDQYDVFLLQGLGTRRWQINTEPVSEANLLPNLALRIMRDFQPAEEWVLAPGDMLYLPPGVAHCGVALEDCITLSVGFRAPAHADIIVGFADEVASSLDENQRYADPELSLLQHPGEISAKALTQIHEIIRSATKDDQTIDHWFGCFITESRSGNSVIEPVQQVESKQFLALLMKHGGIQRSEYARFAFIQKTDGCMLFIDGKEYPLTQELAFAAPLLCDHRQCRYDELAEKLSIKDFTSLLTELYNAGYVFFIE